jgi:predicted DNA-binding protein YlxM (UPF0122 family)
MDGDTVTKTMLFDFFGELLTEKQREYFDLHYNEDLSLAEIAELSGVSRQGVWDIIRRAEQTLRDTEEKTGLIRRFTDMRGIISGLERDLAELIPLLNGRASVLAGSLSAGLAELSKIEE